MSDRRKAIEEELFNIVGYVVPQRPARLETPPENLALLQAALEDLAAPARVHVPTFASMAGLWMWYAIIRRGLLCLLCFVFKCLDEHFYRTVRRWPSTRREVAHMAAVLPSGLCGR